MILFMKDEKKQNGKDVEKEGEGGRLHDSGDSQESRLMRYQFHRIAYIRELRREKERPEI